MNWAPQRPQLTWLDWALLTLFFAGIYLEIPIQITVSIPVPSAAAGIAGLALLFRRRDSITIPQLTALLAVIIIYVVSVFAAPDLSFLAKRFTGLTQIVYSLLCAYAMCLTVLLAHRQQLARFFLTLCLILLIGCFFETYLGLRTISDSVREMIYTQGLYDADLRDQLLYGGIRPKFFASEPSAVTFCITLFSFAWFMVSRSRLRLLGFLTLLGVAQVVAPGPTTLLALMMVGAAYLLLPDANGQIRIANRIGGLFAAALLGLIAIQVGSEIYAERLAIIQNGNDPSFFFRVLGPALVAQDVLLKFPWAGIGLTSEEYVRDMVVNVFVSSPEFSAAWRGATNVAQTLNNYFWLHWTYLGAVFGTVTLVGISVLLRRIAVPSIVFCWVVWAILGQASGAYVSPKTWTVLFLVAALSKVRVAEPTVQAAAPQVPLLARQLAARRPRLALKA